MPKIKNVLHHLRPVLQEMLFVRDAMEVYDTVKRNRLRKIAKKGINPGGKWLK